MAEHRVTSFILLYVSVTDSENATNRTNALFGAATDAQFLRPIEPQGAVGRFVEHSVSSVGDVSRLSPTGSTSVAKC